MEETNEMKNKFWKGVVAGALVTALFILAAVGIAAGIWILGQRSAQSGAARADGSKAETAEGGGTDDGERKPLDMSKITTKLLYMEDLTDKYFLYEDEEHAEDPEEWIYRGYVASLNDPYAAYYSAEEYGSVAEDNAGEYCGIGVQVSQDVYTGIITVVKVFSGSPAEEAGMLPGDLLYEVDGIEASSEDLSLLVSDHIRGEEGTTVPITVYRKSENAYIDMDVERRTVENPTVEYELLDNHVGYISLSTFETVSTEQFQAAFDELAEQGMEKLVLDLRNNGGGLVDVAEAIADYLLPDGLTVVSFKGKTTPESVYTSADGHETYMPVAVLVNGQSASASEVLTGALRDNDAAIVVGTQTYGKGIAQGIFRMSDGSALKLTTAYYYTPSGTCIHKIGITPDVEIELTEGLESQIEIPKDEDNQLKAALDALEKGVDAVNEEIAESAAETEETEEAFPERLDGERKENVVENEGEKEKENEGNGESEREGENEEEGTPAESEGAE